MKRSRVPVCRNTSYRVGRFVKQSPYQLLRLSASENAFSLSHAPNEGKCGFLQLNYDVAAATFKLPPTSPLRSV
ncbi:unnamed protein product [Caenorhabditis nigoni]